MKPLPPGYIRLLQVEAGSQPEISCKLSPVLLASAPTYKALSYTWASADKTHTILNSSKPLAVTANVFSALRRLRYPDRELVIWIDAICINQNNNQERTEQVRMMTEIYYGAEEVLIWLGEETQLLKTAFRLLWMYQDIFEEHGYFETHVDHKIHEKANLPPIIAEEWSGLVALFRMPYFERVWIIQEIVKARQAKVVCGSLLVDWETLANVSRSLQKAGLVGKVGILDSAMGCATVIALSAMKSCPMIEMLPTLESTRHHKATDPRDKYFALLGVVTDNFGDGVPVDYSQSLESVYTAVAIHSLTVGKSLRCLSSTGAGFTPGNSTLPSWVPDWSHDNTGRFNIGSHGCFKATGTSSPTLHVSPDHKSLTIRGFLIDSVSRLSNIARTGLRDYAVDIEKILDPTAYPPRNSSTPAGVEFHKTIIRESLILKNADFIARAGFVPPNQTSDEVLWRTLCCDMTAELTRAPLNFGDSYRIFRAFLDCFDELGEINMARIREMNKYLVFAPEEQVIGLRSKISSTIHSGFKFGLGRRICCTDKNYVGLAVWEAEEGDVIVLFLGADVPFLIRPVKDDPGSYQLIGECYLHGIMDGEAMEMCIREGKIFMDIKLIDRPIIVGEDARDSLKARLAVANQSDLKVIEERKEETSAGGTPGADTLKNALISSINSIKDLYQGPEDSLGRAPWVDKYSKDVEEAAEAEKTENYA